MFKHPVVALVVSVLAIACSGDGGASGSGTGSGSGGDTSADFAEECARMFSCGCEVMGFGDAMACEDAFAAEWAGIEASAKMAGLTPDLACYASTRPWSTYGCQTEEEYAAGGATRPCSRCQHAFGTRATGDPCTIFGERMSDCAEGLLCPEGLGATCVDPCAPAAEGESCAYQPCMEGLVCDFYFETCVALGAEGEACSFNGPGCQEGLECSSETEVCSTKATLGESCAGVSCVEGLTCEAGALTCAEPAGPGESCETIACAPGQGCDPVEWLCKAPGDGEACLEGGFCAAGLECNFDTKVCGPPPGLGEVCWGVCADGSWCALGDSVCVSIPGEGDPCVDPQRCPEGLTCATGSNTCVVTPAAICVRVGA